MTPGNAITAAKTGGIRNYCCGWECRFPLSAQSSTWP
jgi:hypothetical protein